MSLRIQALIAIAALLLAFLGGYGLRGLQAQRDVSALNANHSGQREGLATAQTAAAQQVRADELRTEFRRLETLDADHLHQKAVAAAARRADAEHRRLRDELAVARAAFAALAAHDSAAAQECRATAQTAAVCTDLLGQCSERRRELADFAEGSASAAAVCVGSYRALSPLAISLGGSP